MFEDTYLLELVRYIHLNPLRDRLVRDMTALDKYSFSGHGVIMGRHSNNWQDTDAVLRLFGEKVSDTRKQYRAFVEKGIAIGKREDLIGGGLIRSHGGWASVKAMRRAKIFEKAELSRRMNVSVMTISNAVQRGEKIVKEINISFF